MSKADLDLLLDAYETTLRHARHEYEAADSATKANYNPTFLLHCFAALTQALYEQGYDPLQNLEMLAEQALRFYSEKQLAKRLTATFLHSLRD